MINSVERRTRPNPDLPPLRNGDHLDQKTFHERYEAMPPGVQAELIGGIVYVSSPQMLGHGYHHRKLGRLTDEYVEATPGTDACLNSTAILGSDAEPQPDAFLFIRPEYGGQTRESSGYLTGAPEWVGEISDSTESIDLNRKKLDYEKAGVREYMVVAMRLQEVFWFVRRRGKFKPLAPGEGGIFRSLVFPGFWLDPEAFIQRDGKRLAAVLRQGLSSPEHKQFMASLAERRQ